MNKYIHSDQWKEIAPAQKRSPKKKLGRFELMLISIFAGLVFVLASGYYIYNKGQEKVVYEGRVVGFAVGGKFKHVVRNGKATVRPCTVKPTLIQGTRQVHNPENCEVNYYLLIKGENLKGKDTVVRVLVGQKLFEQVKLEEKIITPEGRFKQLTDEDSKPLELWQWEK